MFYSLSLSGWMFVGVLVFCLVKIVQELRSPLSSIPKASLAVPYSRLLWVFPSEFRGRVTLDLPKIHKRLGPLVRIGPNEVSYYSVNTYDAIHKVGSKYRKDPRVYGEFVQDGSPSLFTTTDPQEHSKRRRLMGQLFNRGQIRHQEDLMMRHVTSFVNMVMERRGVFELRSACRALEADIISDFSFGTPLGAVSSFSRGQELPIVVKNDEKATWMPLLVHFPLLCTLWEELEDVISRVGDLKTPYKRAMVDFHQWCEDSWNNVLSPNVFSSISSPNFIETMVRSGLPPRTALAEAKENLGPGTDTTSASLAHILWALAHNESFQESLFQDLSKISFSTDMTNLEGVPRLAACVREGIRWAGAASAMLPRLVPPGGVELHGNFIPEGTVLTSSPIWYLRDPIAFPKPEAFNPYRWMTSDGKAIRDDPLRDRFYIPFSKGANICVAQHFAYLELYISVSQIIRHFRLRVSPALRNGSPFLIKASYEPFQSPPLPSRKEWVAAVLTEKLFLMWEPRASDCKATDA